MLIDRDGIRLMGERKGQQATSQARQLRVEAFRRALPVTQKVPQHRLGAVQRIQQPEQRDIGYGKISHPFIAFATHGHQARQTSPELDEQLFKLRRQPAAAWICSSGGRNVSSISRAPCESRCRRTSGQVR